jgi:hypothetical protein
MTRQAAPPPTEIAYGTPCCPNPQKRRFNTEAFANKAATAQTIRAGKPIASYPCQCGGYHLTSKRPRKNRPSRRPLMNTSNGTITYPLTDAPADAGSAVVWSSEHVEPIEELLQRAEQGTERVRALAADIRGRIADLGDVIEVDEKVAAWMGELEEISARKTELEGLLAQALDTRPAITIDLGEPAEDDAESDLNAALDLHALVTKFAFDGRVRGWARGQGYEVAKQGRIATSIVRMWIAAHPDVAAADAR